MTDRWTVWMGFKKTEFKVGSLMAVKWHDITTYTSWHEIESARPLVNCTTIGLVLRESETEVELAHTFGSNGQVTDVTVIPKCVIYSKEILVPG